MQNRQVLLKSRPEGEVSDEHFEVVEHPLPALEEGQFLVKNLYLSIDPTIRSWIDRDTYLPAIELGAVVRSGGVGEVVESKNAHFSVGDRVSGLVGWQQYALLGEDARLDRIPTGVDLQDALSVFGLTGLTAYFGLTDVGRPKSGETVVVSGAAGATGSVVGQIAKILGCRVVGIAGSDDKCRWLTDELGFDAAINYKTQDMAQALKEACPKRIDVYFDNVGGVILDRVLSRLALRGRVVLCGAISQYNDLAHPYGLQNTINLISLRGRMEGFLIFDYAARFGEATKQLGAWVAEGKIKHKTTVVDGLDNAPDALRRLFSGEHEGKLMVRLDTAE